MILRFERLRVHVKKILTILRAHFNLNLARIKCLTTMIVAILESRSVQPSKLGRYFGGRAKSDSAVKRIHRLLKEVILPKDSVARLCVTLSGLKDGPLELIFDRTNWKFGKTHINFLFLCAAHNGIAIPLFFKLLVDKKQGNSSYLDRIELLEQFIASFGQERIAVVLGDREFVGKRWIIWLRRKRIPFVMRLPEKKTKISHNDDDAFISGNQLFKGLRKGQKRTLGFCLVGQTDSYKACVSALRSRDKSLVVLVHSNDIENPFARYRKRWQIESMFRALKTGGFNVEDIHIKEPSRLAQLVAVLAITFCIAYRAGTLVSQKTKKVVKNHGYREKSLIRLGLDFLWETISAAIITPFSDSEKFLSGSLQQK